MILPTCLLAMLWNNVTANTFQLVIVWSDVIANILYLAMF